MVNVTEAICTENKTAFQNISLSRRTTVRHVKVMYSDLLTQLNDTAQTFAYFFIALDGMTQLSSDIYTSCERHVWCHH